MNLWGHLFSQNPNQNYRDFCPGSFLEGRAEIWEIFGWQFGRKDDLINSFWIQLTFIYISLTYILSIRFKYLFTHDSSVTFLFKHQKPFFFVMSKMKLEIQGRACRFQKRFEKITGHSNPGFLNPKFQLRTFQY